MKECEMLAAIDAWLEAQGCVPLHETPLVHWCDVVGVLFAQRTSYRIPPVYRAIAVELKVEDVAGVIQQAVENRTCVHRSYAAMPRSRCDKMRPATLRKFVDAGIGLLSVDGNEVITLIEAAPGQWQESFGKKFWRRVRKVNGPRENP